MDFDSYAARELPALIDRLLATRAERAKRDFQAIRKTFDEAVAAAQAAADATDDHGADVTALVAKLAKAAATQAETATGQIAAKLQETIDGLHAKTEKLTGENRQLAQSVIEAKAETAKAKSDIERVEAAKAKVEAERKEAASERVRAEQARAALDDELQETRQLLETARSESGRIAQEFERNAAARTAAEVQRYVAERADLAAQIEQHSAELGRLTAEAQHHAAERAQLTARLERHEAERVQLQAELERVRAEAADSEQQRSSGHGDATVQIDRLMTSLYGISQSATIGDVLAGIADGLIKEFGRVAIFTVRDNRLKPACHAGFESNSGISKVVIPMTVDSVLTQSLSSDDVRTFTGKALKPGLLPPFGGSPTLVVTAPISVGEQQIAVIYADDAGPVAANATDKTKIVDLLRQYALARLELLTAQLKMLQELRAYAKLLLDEIEYVYAADASAKKPTAERQTRLSESLRCARQMYEQRAAPDGAAALAVLDQQLRALLEAKASTPFGKDLAAVAKTADAKQASQAS